MPSPFPGMDPYIERAELWPDLHDSLITAIRGLLNPQLRPRYAALTQDRLYVFESARPLFPDVSVVETSRPRTPGPASVSTIQAEAPAVFDLSTESIREPYIEIIEPAAGNRVVTAIEVVSPTNKITGEGRDSYLKKRRELWAGGVNIVEIDLLRGGDPVIWVTHDRLNRLRPWHYIVAVSRRRELKQDVYAVTLAKPLPTIAIPLAHDDHDVPLDLQAALARCWDEGPYPETLRYDEPPPPPLAADDARWCMARVQKGGAA